VVRKLVDLVDNFSGIPPTDLTRSVAMFCGCRRPEIGTAKAITCAAYAAPHPGEPVNAPAGRNEKDGGHTTQAGLSNTNLIDGGGGSTSGGGENSGDAAGITMKDVHTTLVRGIQTRLRFCVLLMDQNIGLNPPSPY
jgi:hypothetical protein